ncbi:hypothetical protein KI387_041197, partial [Taxus chinensis]
LHKETRKWQDLIAGMTQNYDYFSTKPLLEEALWVIKHLIMGDSEKFEELIQELFGEVCSGACFDEVEERDSKLLKCSFFKKEK